MVWYGGWPIASAQQHVSAATGLDAKALPPFGKMELDAIRRAQSSRPCVIFFFGAEVFNALSSRVMQLILSDYDGW